MNPRSLFNRFANNSGRTVAAVFAIAVVSLPTLSGQTADNAGPAAAAIESAHGMVLVPSAERVVGTSLDERRELARQFDCDPTWLNDDLTKRAVHLAPFWIDCFPVSNGQYAAFVEATGARPPWPGGRFPADTADHPVVGVSYYEAEAYAKWVGKRLPTAEEWEVAALSGQGGPFPWGDDWPGPVQRQNPDAIPDWQRPGTVPLGSGRHGKSAVGMEDFIRQVFEWTSSTMPHHGTTFVQVKGTSWLSEDAVNFRTAAGSWTAGFFLAPWIGFRCAMDGTQQPAPVIQKTLSEVPHTPSAASPVAVDHASRIEVYHLRNAPANLAASLLWWNRLWLAGGPIVPIPQSRGFLLHAPAMGPWPVCLQLAEALLWNDQPLLGPMSADPSLEEIKTESGGLAYRLALRKGIDLTYEFVTGADFVDLLTTVVNQTDQAGTFSTSSCFSLTCNPLFYDCEMVRTYQWTPNAGFVPLRQIPRPGDCVRWIEPSDSTRYGGPGSPGTAAVVSRDGNWTFASVQTETEAPVTIQGNTWLNCLHTDAPVRVDARSSRTTRQRLYFLRGDLQTLQSRLQQDLGAP